MTTHLPLTDITNLCSALSLTPTQLEILEKGLTFIPTPKPPTRPELRVDLHTFHRRLKLLDHFWGAPRREPVPFTGPSSVLRKIHITSSPADFRKHLQRPGKAGSSPEKDVRTRTTSPNTPKAWTKFPNTSRGRERPNRVRKKMPEPRLLYQTTTRFDA